MSLFSSAWSQVIGVNVYEGYDDRGNIKYSPARSEEGSPVPCRIEYANKKTLNSKGEEVLSTATMFCDCYIPPLSIITVDNNQKYTVISSSPCRSVAGIIDHFEIALG